MKNVSIRSQISALEIALGRNGCGVWREPQQELHRKPLEAALETLRLVERHPVIFGSVELLEQKLAEIAALSDREDS